MGGFSLWVFRHQNDQWRGGKSCGELRGYDWQRCSQTWSNSFGKTALPVLTRTSPHHRIESTHSESRHDWDKKERSARSPATQ